MTARFQIASTFAGSGLLALLLAVLVCPLRADDTSQRTLQILRDRYAALNRRFADQFLDVAADAERQGFAGEAAQIRLRSAPFSQQLLDVDDLPGEIVPAPSLDLPEAERAWRVKLAELESDYAAELYRLSRDALRLHHPSYAFQLVREVAFHDPNHKYARGLLGYVRLGDEWTTPFAKLMQTKGYVDHPEFGWIPARYVGRYENGEREVNGRWVSAEKESAIRADFAHAWEVPTEHFLIRTNHSLQAGVAIGRELERFHRFFMREFAAFFTTPQQMQRLFENGAGAASNRASRYKVYYFRNRDEYLQALRPRQPQIDVTNGLYMPDDRIAYLYHDPEHPEEFSTIYHEVTHQLLGETTNQFYPVARQSNFWLIEGVACYMETVRKRGDGLEVGTPRDDRIFWAKEYLVGDGFFVPMAQFTPLGMEDFRAVPQNLQRYYAQACGMVHFFLNYEDGLYRDAFIEHLSQVYSPSARIRAHTDSLEELTGTSFAVLDQKYRDYIQSLPAEPESAPAGEGLRAGSPRP